MCSSALRNLDFSFQNCGFLTFFNLDQDITESFNRNAQPCIAFKVEFSLPLPRKFYDLDLCERFSGFVK